jgi:hypothetical protein
MIANKNSLEKDPLKRKYPQQMLDDPWMVENRNRRVNMEAFLKQVWDWKD